MTKILTCNEVAERLRVKVDTVYRYINNGDLPYVTFGRKKLVDEKDLEALINKKKKSH